MDSRPLVSPDPTQRSRPARRGRWIWLAVAAVLMALLVWRHPWTAHHGPAAGRPHGRRGAEASNESQAVTAAVVGRGDVPISFASLGTVTPLVTVTIRSQISGYLTDVAFTEGQMVRQGDFLAQIDDRPYQAVLEQYQGNLLRDQALLKNAVVDLARYQKLARQDSISNQNLDTQAATVAQYQGAVKTDQGQIDAEKLDITYCHITAPSDGRLGLRQVDVGNYVTAGDTNGLVILTKLQPISVIFTVPQTQLEPVLAGMRGGPLQVAALDSDDTTVLGIGMVQTIDNQLDTTTGTVKLRADFANAGLTLFPNQFVNTSLLVSTVRNAVVVPNEAVQRGTPGTYAYVIGADRTVSLRIIAVGASAKGMTVVTSGLAPGESVVLQGTSRLRAGAKVEIVRQPAAAANGSTGGAALGQAP